MGTYSDSKFVTAKRAHECGNCGREILRGQMYLRYKLGLRNDIKRCSECAIEIRDEGARKGSPVYDCAAVREALGMPPAIGRVG